MRKLIAVCDVTTCVIFGAVAMVLVESTVLMAIVMGWAQIVR